MKRALAAISVFIVLTAAVCFWTLRDFDAKLQSGLERVVFEKTGRVLSIAGAKTRLSLSPSVELRDMSLRDGDKTLAKVGLLSAEIELMPLLSRRAEVKRFVLRDVSIDAVVNAAENYKKNNDSPAFGTPVENVAVKSARDGFELRLNDVLFEKMRVTLTDAAKGATYVAAIDELTIKENDGKADLNADAMVGGEEYDVRARVDYASRAFDAEIKNPRLFAKINGTAASFADWNAVVKANVTDLKVFKNVVIGLPALENVVATARVEKRAGAVSVPEFDVSTVMNGVLTARISGGVSSFSPLKTDFSADVDAPDLSKIDGFPALPASRIVAAGKIDGGLKIDGLSVVIGKSDLSGTVFAEKKPRLSVHADLKSSVLDLSELLSVNSKSRLTAAIGKTRNRRRAEIPVGKKRVFSDKPLDLNALRAADVNVRASVAKLIAADGTDLGKVDASAAMNGGKFALSNFKLANYLSAQAVMDATGGKAVVGTNVRISALPLKMFWAKSGVDKGTLSGSVVLSGRGASRREIAASLNGKIRLDIRGAHAGAIQIVPAQMSFLKLSKVNEITIPCAVVNLPVVKGVVTSDKKIGFESDLFDLQISGNADLGTENLNLKIKMTPHSTGILENSVTSATVGGTLGAPKIRLDQNESLNRALSIGVAFFMGGKDLAQEMAKEGALTNVCATAAK